MEENKSFYAILESDLIFDKRINPTTKLVYAVISNYSNNKNGYCYLNHFQLAVMIGITKRQMTRCVYDLKKYNYITIVRKKNRYFLMPTINVITELRKKAPINTELFEYDWLNEKN